MTRWNPARRRPIGGPGSQTAIIIDSYEPGDIKRFKEAQEALAQVHWRWYNELAGQRASVIDKIKAALAEAATGPIDFISYQRAVKFQWSLNPLSPEGSLKDPGGRFNIGEIDLTRYPASPALYIGQDKDTVLQEIFSGDKIDGAGLSSRELALTNSDSISIVSIKGHLESVLDLTQPNRLRPLVQIFRKFKPSTSLNRAAKKCGIDIGVIQNVSQLVTSLLQPDWRRFSMHVDIPANSQIFGNLVEQSGIETVLYLSKYTQKKCLAIFTRNFKSGSSFVELEGELPPGVSIKRLDATNCRMY